MIQFEAKIYSQKKACFSHFQTATSVGFLFEVLSLFNKGKHQVYVMKNLFCPSSNENCITTRETACKHENESHTIHAIAKEKNGE